MKDAEHYKFSTAKRKQQPCEAVKNGIEQENKPTETGKQKALRITKKLAKRWFIDAFTGMAIGLFATLIAGTILVQIGKLIGTNIVGNIFVNIGKMAQTLMGAGIGAGIAYMLKADKLTMFSCMVAGFVGAFGNGFDTMNISLGAPGNPIGAYLTSVFACEICMLIAGKTKVDIVVIPLTAMLVSFLIVISLCKPVNIAIKALAMGIAKAMDWSPVFMGVVIAVVMGILLTMPTSSAAIWVSICLAFPDSPNLLLAGGAAVVGCSAQMIGFAVSSFRENRWGGLIAQGLGTSMLQIPNIMKKPVILIPPTIASAVVGALAPTVFELKCNASGGGMGTAGLVGVFGTIEASAGLETWKLVLGIILLMFVIPALVSLGFSELFRKLKWIKPGDMKLELGK